MKELDIQFIQNAINYATECHRTTNHRYDGWPYEYHLQMVYNFALKYIDLVPKDKQGIALAAAFCHDVIEDTRQTYNDVLRATNKEVADIVYALTNQKGRNRKERASDSYYSGIRENPIAHFIKICDRLANVKHSKETNSRMFELYQKEQQEFSWQLAKDIEPWDELVQILKS